MNVNTSPVTYSSIVKIGELAAKLEKETGDKYLKLHRGVMDVTTIDLNLISQTIDFNQKKIQQYGGNDGDAGLIDTIKNKFHLNNHYVITVPGGMATLDVVINSLSDKTFWVPKYHWGSWNKILTIHNKDIKTFDDFDINNVEVGEGVVMLCYPSNPTGYAPKFEDLKTFVEVCKKRNQTPIGKNCFFRWIYDGLRPHSLSNPKLASGTLMLVDTKEIFQKYFDPKYNDYLGDVLTGQEATQRAIDAWSEAIYECTKFIVPISNSSLAAQLAFESAAVGMNLSGAVFSAAVAQYATVLGNGMILMGLGFTPTVPNTIFIPTSVNQVHANMCQDFSYQLITWFGTGFGTRILPPNDVVVWQ